MTVERIGQGNSWSVCRGGKRDVRDREGIFDC